MLTIAALIFGLLAAEPAVKFIFPRSSLVGSCPVEALVQLRVPRDPTNRRVEVVWDSIDGEAGSFVIQVDGSASPAVLPREPRMIRLGAPGEYVLRATLWASQRGSWVVAGTDHREIRVIGRCF
jgi:hypothetical protein